MSSPVRKPIPLGRYLLLERVSVGGMAEVFRAKLRGEPGILAIKRILPSLAEDSDFITMFIDEARIAGHLHHPNVCEIYELARVDDAYFIAMEYVWGKDVLQIQNRFKRLKRELPLGMAVFIASKVCAGLQYAHSRRDGDGRPLDIVHRDISPQNVLVSYEGEVKLIDFGIAKAVSRSSKTQAGVLKGKFGYMSPEQVRGLPLDQRSDIFALGTVLYELCTGRRLFSGESDFAVLDKVRNAHVLPPRQRNAQIPERLEQVIMRALQRDADARFQRASEFQGELEHLLNSGELAFDQHSVSTDLKEVFSREVEREQAALKRYETLEQNAPRSMSKVISLLDVPIDGDLGSTTIKAPKQEGGGGPLNELHERESNPASLKKPTTGETQVFVGSGGNQALLSEPTYIFDQSAGQIKQAAEPTVIFDSVGSRPQNFVASGSAAQEVGTPGGPTSRRSTFRDIAIGVSVAIGLIVAGLFVWRIAGGPSNKNPAARLVVKSAFDNEAQVSIDGSIRGKVGPGKPLMVERLALGLHRVALVVKNRTVVMKEVTLEAGDAPTITLSPIPKVPHRKTGYVALVVDPANAQVMIDGRSLPATALGKIALATHKIHTLAIRADGYSPQDLRIEVQADKTLTKRVRLEKVLAGETAAKRAAKKTSAQASSAQRRGGLQRQRLRSPRGRMTARDSQSADAGLVSRDSGKSTAPTPTKQTTPEPVDLPDEPLRKPNWGSTDGSASGAKGKPGAQQPNSQVGYLVANTTPWARVFVDGRDTGMNTPVPPKRKLKLSVGSHTVTFVARGKRYKYQVIIREGQVTKLIKTLSDESPK